jgi:L-ribulose-5-phosphate 4-epimerase
MLEVLKSQVCHANIMLESLKLISFTWGNVSGLDRKTGLVVIKPSGVPYSMLRPEDMVVVDLNGKTVEGSLNPSSDTPTHIMLYKQYPEMGGVVHTHSPYATAFAQCRRSIPPLGTTHADYFYGTVPCTRELTKNEIESCYEENTGNVIIETLGNSEVMSIPAILVASHGVFAWGADAKKAVMNAAYLEETAKLAYRTFMLDGAAAPVDQFLLDKHYQRKHGKNAYYGQEEKNE